MVLDQAGYDIGQARQALTIIRIEFAWFVVDQAQCPERVAFCRDDWGAGIKPDFWLACNQWIGRKAFVLKCIFNDEYAGASDRVITECDAAVCLCNAFKSLI